MLRPQQTNLTAVCLVGEQRTFLEPVVQHAFAHKLHRPGCETQLDPWLHSRVPDSPRPPECLQMSTLSSPIRRGLHLIGSSSRRSEHGSRKDCEQLV
eukprot:5856903-Prymnesium_polylepis.1